MAVPSFNGQFCIKLSAPERSSSSSAPFFSFSFWEAFLLALKEIGFKGCFSLETYPSLKTPQPILDEMRVSLSRLAKMMADKLE